MYCETQRELELLAKLQRQFPESNDYLLELVKTADSATFAEVHEALTIHRRDAVLSERIVAAVAERNRAR